jgi:4-hydroxy-tetrahydrodipicolinate synthase
VNVEPATLVRLAEIKNIVGVKEASGNMGQMASILARVPESFLVLAGDDAVALPLIALGGKGVISVVSNEVPKEFTTLIRKALEGDFTGARELQRKYQSLMEVNFVEVSPGPVKYAMFRMGLLEAVWRLPMIPPSAASKQRVDEVLETLGLTVASRLAGARA